MGLRHIHLEVPLKVYSTVRRSRTTTTAFASTDMQNLMDAASATRTDTLDILFSASSTGRGTDGDAKGESSALFTFSSCPTLEEIRLCQRDFVIERGWDKINTPRNLLLALVGEVGEVAELFQWKGDCQEGLSSEWSEKERQQLGEEVADVLIYLVNLADKCRIDLSKVTEQKMQLNALKYPADVVYGSSKKYTEYREKKAENIPE